MTVFDLIVIAIVAASVGISIWRGMVREVLALASWIGAFWIAKELAGFTATWLPDSVSNPGPHNDKVHVPAKHIAPQRFS